MCTSVLRYHSKRRDDSAHMNSSISCERN
uniref:Uncharacterized protein n=1 Tax=Arundo donax TaxID=35708 RepID=A0A0A8YVN0_ARUDO